MCEGKVRKWVRDFKTGHDSFSWEVLDHPPYNLDLTPSDFYLYQYLKRHLDGNHYNDKEVMKTAVTSWLLEQMTSYFQENI